jgi:hypothetical protein
VLHSKLSKTTPLGPGLNTPHACTMVKTLKLEIYLFLEFWFQIWFQKYFISPNATQFLINKHKNRGRFLFTFLGLVRAWGVSCQIAPLVPNVHSIKMRHMDIVHSHVVTLIHTLITCPKCHFRRCNNKEFWM